MLKTAFRIGIFLVAYRLTSPWLGACLAFHASVESLRVWEERSPGPGDGNLGMSLWLVPGLEVYRGAGAKIS